MKNKLNPKEEAIPVWRVKRKERNAQSKAKQNKTIEEWRIN